MKIYHLATPVGNLFPLLPLCVDGPLSTGLGGRDMTRFVRKTSLLARITDIKNAQKNLLCIFSNLHTYVISKPTLGRYLCMYVCMYLINWYV
jgi:hypothetical protein